jgi:hypothetical protein
LVTPLREPADQTGRLVCPECKTGIVRQEIAQPVFKTRPAGILLAQIKIAGVMSRSRYVTAKISDGSLGAVASDGAESREQVRDDVVEQIISVLRRCGAIVKVKTQSGTENFSDDRKRVLVDESAEPEVCLLFVCRLCKLE